MSRTLLVVEVVVYPTMTAVRYEFGKLTLEEKYRRPALTRRRRKKLNAKKKL